MTSTKARRCGTKRRHETRDAALGHLYALVRKGASPALVNVYSCTDCGSWHVGNGRARKR